jgi:hypothetical protein
MTTKHPGGRGRRAQNKHETFSVSLPPDLKAHLDAWTTPEVSRSEVVAGLVRAHAAQLAHRSAVKAPPADGAGNRAPRIVAAPILTGGDTVQVVAVSVPRSLQWKSARMAEVETLLRQGDTLTRHGKTWRTVQGAELGERAVQALLTVGVLVPGGNVATTST